MTVSKLQPIDEASLMTVKSISHTGVKKLLLAHGKIILIYLASLKLLAYLITFTRYISEAIIFFLCIFDTFS